MNPLLRSLLALLFLYSGFCHADETKDMKPEAFIHLYEKALATQDWEQVSPLIHPDCTVTFSSGACHKGKDAVRIAFQRNFDLIKDETYSISEVHWVTKTEDHAVFTYCYAWSGIIAGEKASGEGRGTSTITRVDANWQLVAEHLGAKD